jgi:chemotaxis regulatin CheY-phosphate phosphatase CheZ
MTEQDMPDQDPPSAVPTPLPDEPESLLVEFRERSEALDRRLDNLLELIQSIRGELRDESTRSLSRLAEVATDMANGRVYQRIDLEAKGEIGALVASLNQTLANLQQLDASVKQQSTQVPELAAQLDAITADTEEATQSVMNRLDTLMGAADAAGHAIQAAAKAHQEREATHQRFQERIDAFLARATEGEDPQRVAQEVLDFLFEHQTTTRLPQVDLSACQEQLKGISDEAFEILNTLQFQDITRQKVEKVVQLLKQFKTGLGRLLAIFKIEGEEGEAATGQEVFEQRQVATQDHIFDVSLEADQKKESVEDIIAQFRKGKG